jgi:antitoxin component YwqK of YwqJK toxin-antitoxin module
MRPGDDESPSNGDHIDLYDNGNVRWKGSFLNGQQHGLWEFFRKDGSLMRSGSFTNGVQTGTWTTHLRDGTPHKSTDFGDSTPSPKDG